MKNLSYSLFSYATKPLPRSCVTQPVIAWGYGVWSRRSCVGIHGILITPVQCKFIAHEFFEPPIAQAAQGLSILRGAFKQLSTHSSIYLIERPSIRITAVPYLIHNLRRLNIVFASRPGHDGKDGPSTHTLLMLLGELPLPSREKLSRPPAFAAQGRCSYLL